MTNRLAIILGLVILSGIAADLYLEDGAGLLYLGRKLFVLIDWLAFWH